MRHLSCAKAAPHDVRQLWDFGERESIGCFLMQPRVMESIAALSWTRTLEVVLLVARSLLFLLQSADQSMQLFWQGERE